MCLTLVLASTTSFAAEEKGAVKSDKDIGLHSDGGAWQFYRQETSGDLPRVLLMGDSIMNGYRGRVIAALKDKAVVDCWLTPLHLKSKELHHDLRKVLQQGPYDVVHFNIGLHGWPPGLIPEGQYEPLLRQYVEIIKSHSGTSRLIWASTTQITVKGKPTELDPVHNKTILARNAIAAKLMPKYGIAVNDICGLMSDKLKLARGDGYHWNGKAYDLMAKQIVSYVQVAIAGGPRVMHVALHGRDTNPGTKDKPFATLEAARDAIRKLDVSAKAKGVTVWIASGTYISNKSFELDACDSGTKAGPIVYRAVEGATISVMGGERIPVCSFKAIEDKNVIDRLVPEARASVLQCNLRELGITDYGQRSSRVNNELVKGAMFSKQVTAPELFFRNDALPLSRWPNTGWATYGKVIDKGSMPRVGEKPDCPGTVEYTGTRPERWTKAEHIFIHGYFAWDWFDDVLKVATLDTKQKRITFTTPHMYGLKPNKRYRVMGLLEEIDQPGEWMIDHKTGILYFFPPIDMATGEFALSMLETPLIQMTGTQYVTLRGLTLEVTRGTCVDIAGGTDNLVAGCIMRNSGACGVVIHPIGFDVKDAGGLHQFPKASGDPLKDGRCNGVVGCDLYNIGTTGISMIGGDRKTLTPGGHYAVNNDIHHYARRQRANQPAINMNGVGHRAAHNYIHDAPHVGLDYSGNDHMIEFNEIARVCQETSDVGVIYSGRNWTYRGNIVRYNFIHHPGGRAGHGSFSVYLDDSCSSTHIYGNVFYKVQKAVLIGGGRDNIMENNIIVDSGIALQFDNRSEGWARKYQIPGGDHRMYAKLKEVRHDKPPYSTRYPALARILEENPHKPLGNKVLNNICIRSGWIVGPKQYLQIGDNLVTKDDPGFRDVKGLDFTLKDLSLVQKKLPGFKPIPFNKIGLYVDKFRQMNE